MYLRDFYFVRRWEEVSWYFVLETAGRYHPAFVVGYFAHHQRVARHNMDLSLWLYHSLFRATSLLSYFEHLHRTTVSECRWQHPFILVLHSFLELEIGFSSIFIFLISFGDVFSTVSLMSARIGCWNWLARRKDSLYLCFIIRYWFPLPCAGGIWRSSLWRAWTMLLYQNQGAFSLLSLSNCPSRG